MKTLLEFQRLSADYLNSKGIENAERETDLLFSGLLDLERYELYANFDRPLKESEIDILREGLKRRAFGEPWQYIVGEVKFYDVKIKVSKDVLIPRQETEILVDMVCKKIRKRGRNKVLDLCTGSGCIGIAIKKAIPELDVYAVDISSKALDIAKENASYNSVAINYIQGDLLALLEKEKFDYIVCNPPYIAQHELSRLPLEVKGFEPVEALDGGPNGLTFYKKLSCQIDKYLMPHGQLWFEMGASQGKKLKELFEKDCWKSKDVIQDLSGQDRFFFLERE